MNNETKEAVLALLAARQYVFSLLHALTGAQPTAELVAAATGEASQQALSLLDDGEHDAPQLVREALRLLKEADLSALKDEYTRLFLGPDDMIAGPWESVYTSKERALFQESTLDVRVWFRRFGYVAGGYPNFPDDHITLMMEFLARTCEMAAQELAQENAAGCAGILRDQQAFEAAHLLNWLRAYAGDIQLSPTNVFYPPLAIALAEYIAYDHEVLTELASACA